MSNAAGPIADLSYRTYDGALDAPTQRWKVIARANIMRVIKHKGYWWCMILGGWYYGIMFIGLFILDWMLSAGGGDAEQALRQLGRIDWSAQFLHGYSFGQIWYLFVALAVGAGAIANDNRTNALLVYLSKPCTKKDYVIGKWVGVFIPLFFAMLVPALFFYAFGAMNYREFGFLSDDPWLIVKLLVITLIGAAFHASLILGVSSLFNQGRMASATYVGAYFISNIVSVILGIIMSESHGGAEGVRSFASGLYYCSIDGVNIGVAKIILGLDSPNLFVGADNGFNIDRPSPYLAFGLVVLLSVFALRLLWKRVRAVEVVG